MSEYYITMKPMRIYPNYDIYDGEINMDFNIMPMHKSVITTIGIIVIIIMTPFILWEYIIGTLVKKIDINGLIM